ncbi:MAG: hypothetical protein PHR06_15160, partial [Candidatus Cloacimonetes bacterium]|nr:hypothetical protein [Candidatus Cloacimonadota bacterium]
MKRLFSLAVICLLISTLFSAELLVVNSVSETLSMIDLDNQQINNTFAILGQSAGNAANKIAVQNDYAYITITYENSIQKINLSSRERSYIFLQDSSLPYDIVIADNFAYVTCSGINKVAKVNLNNDTVVDYVNVGIAPESITQDDNYLFVGNTGFNLSDYSYAPGTVSVINKESFTLIETLTTALNPRGVLVTDNQLHVICSGDYFSEFGKISVYNLDDYQLITTISTGGNPYTGVSSSDRIFLGNAYPAGIYAYNKSTFAIEVTPDDNLLLGGNALTVYENHLIIGDAGDYMSNSHVRIYNLDNYSLIHDFQTAVGVSDVKVYTEDVQTSEHLLVRLAELTSVSPNPLRINGQNRSNWAKISLSLKEDAMIDISLYNLKGQRVAAIANGQKEKGVHLIEWQTQSLMNEKISNGVYFYNLKING